MEEKGHFAAKDKVSNTPTDTAIKKPEGIRVNFRIPISRKVLLYITLPIIIIGLLLFGLIQQGFVGGWLKTFRKASATVTVLTADNQPLKDARVIFGDIFDTTGDSGATTVEGLFSGQQEMSVQKTGFIGVKKTVNLKKGANNLGTVTLNEAPIPKVDLTIGVFNYISEESIANATVKIGDIVATADSGQYLLREVPLGTHTLEASLNGFNTFSKEVVVEKKGELERIEMVPSGLVVFESNRDGGKRGIFTANYDGSDQKSLVSRVGSFEDFTPILGPNQRKLFFTSTRDGQRREGSSELRTYLYVVDIDGKNLTKISENSGAYATWSPEGGFIGYTKYNPDYSSSELNTYNVVQKTAHKFAGYNSNSFTFSQSGNQIAFNSRDNTSGENKLHLGNSDATNIINIANGSSNGYYSIEFAAANKLRYSAYDSAANSDRWYQYDIATGATSEISAPEIDREGAVLSPDKKTRAYVSTRDGKTNLYISDADGKNEKKLTELNRVVGSVLWSKEGNFILFDYRSDEESARYLVSTNGKAKPKKIVDINLTYYY